MCNVGTRAEFFCFFFSISCSQVVIKNHQTTFLFQMINFSLKWCHLSLNPHFGCFTWAHVLIYSIHIFGHACLYKHIIIILFKKKCFLPLCIFFYLCIFFFLYAFYLTTLFETTCSLKILEHFCKNQAKKDMAPLCPEFWVLNKVYVSSCCLP